MSSFRLARLLRLRQDQAEAAKQQWALAQRRVVEAQEQLEGARVRLGSAREELAEDLGGVRSGGAVASVLGAHRALDSLEDALAAQRLEVDARRATAAGLRTTYEATRRAEEALRRLEERWRTSERARRRRRDERHRDEFIAGRAARSLQGQGSTASAPIDPSLTTGTPSRRST